MLGQQQAGLGGAESQVAGPDLGQLTGQPVAVQGQQRIPPGGDHHAQARLRVPQDEVKLGQYRRPGQDMEVVDDQCHRRVLGSQRRRKPHQECMVCRPSARSSRQHLRKGNSGPAQGRDGIGPEGAGLVVEVVQGNPGNSTGFGRRPQRQGHRFARAGRASDDGQPASPRALGDQLGDPRPRHRPVRHTWHGDPGCQDGDTSGNCRPSGGSRHLPGNIGHHRIFLLPAGGLMAARHGRPHVAIPPRPAAVRTSRPHPPANASQPG